MTAATVRRRPAKSSRAKPAILFVDDRAHELSHTVRLAFSQQCAVDIQDPEELRKSAVLNADLILVDFDLADWHAAVKDDESDEPIARRAPQDGLALIAQLRSIGETVSRPRPTAYAIDTAQRGKLPGGQSWEGAPHLLARALGVEWVFEKGVIDSSDQVVDLAKAARLLPRSWPKAAPRATRALHQLLGLDSNAKWSMRAAEQMSSCEPPLQETAVATRGLSILRWMLHGVLPYPTFLIDDRILALRLGVSSPSLRLTLQNNTAFERMLAPAAYKGILARFLGNRWWRAGVDSIVWNRTKGSADAIKLTDDLISRFPTLDSLALSHPVPLLDDRLRPSDAVAEVTSAVEVRPDGWPTYAERAWVALEDVIDNDQLRALVVDADADRLPTQ
jgi:hypothetical protein